MFEISNAIIWEEVIVNLLFSIIFFLAGWGANDLHKRYIKNVVKKWEKENY